MAEPTQPEITRLISAEYRATKDSDFVDTVVFSPTLIQGTRYKYVLTDAQDPREES